MGRSETGRGKLGLVEKRSRRCIQKWTCYLERQKINEANELTRALQASDIEQELMSGGGLEILIRGVTNGRGKAEPRSGKFVFESRNRRPCR